jgi:hypothetical protein
MTYVGQIEVKDKSCHLMVRAYQDGAVTTFKVSGAVVYGDYYPFKNIEAENEVGDKDVRIPNHVYNKSLWGKRISQQGRTAINNRLTALLTTDAMRQWFSEKRKKQG